MKSAMRRITTKDAQRKHPECQQSQMHSTTNAELWTGKSTKSGAIHRFECFDKIASLSWNVHEHTARTSMIKMSEHTSVASTLLQALLYYVH